MELANKLELHYYFDDDTHSMDAFVRHKCEGEVLAIINETSRILGMDIRIDSEAYREGGLKEIWKALGSNDKQISIILSTVAIILALNAGDSEHDSLRKELTELSIEEKKLNIKKLKKELSEKPLNNESIKAAASEVNRSHKIRVRKSNFYKALSHYPKVSKIGVSGLDNDGMKTREELFVSRADFKNFILLTDKLTPTVVEDAEIEIISPVLKRGKYKWKGVYEKEPISFSLKDKLFKTSVYDKTTTFMNGTTLVCVLTIHQKLDEFGDIVISGYAVETVVEIIDSTGTIETKQGKEHKFTKKQTDGQSELFH